LLELVLTDQTMNGGVFNAAVLLLALKNLVIPPTTFKPDD